MYNNNAPISNHTPVQPSPSEASLWLIKQAIERQDNLKTIQYLLISSSIFTQGRVNEQLDLLNYVLERKVGDKSAIRETLTQCINGMEAQKRRELMLHAMLVDGGLFNKFMRERALKKVDEAVDKGSLMPPNDSIRDFMEAYRSQGLFLDSAKLEKAVAKHLAQTSIELLPETKTPKKFG